MYSVLGENGFIGSHLKRHIQSKGHVVANTPRDILSLPQEQNLGHVIYCIGLTADFRTRPYETVEAHVSLLSQFLDKYTFDSFLYLSSARVYQNNSSTDEEAALLVNPNQAGDLYNISKLLGESVCNNTSHNNIKIARLSNIFSANMPEENFLYDITEKAIKDKSLILRSTLESSKDYLAIEQAVEVLYQISSRGEQFIYNVASGYNTSTEEIISILKSKYDFELVIENDAKDIHFPLICTNKIRSEFSFSESVFQNQYLNLISSIESKIF